MDTQCKFLCLGSNAFAALFLLCCTLFNCNHKVTFSKRPHVLITSVVTRQQRTCVVQARWRHSGQRFRRFLRRKKTPKEASLDEESFSFLPECGAGVCIPHRAAFHEAFGVFLSQIAKVTFLSSSSLSEDRKMHHLLRRFSSCAALVTITINSEKVPPRSEFIWKLTFLKKKKKIN